MLHRVPSIGGGLRVAASLTVWLLAAAAVLPAHPAWAQSSAPAPAADQTATPNPDGAKTNKFVEAQRVLNGPAGNPECMDLGTKALFRLQQDDIDTAFRHLDLYDRFGCPGGQIQAAYRCLLLHPVTPDRKPADPKASGTLEETVDACWINPASPQLTSAAAAAPAAPTPAAPSAAAAPSQTSTH